MKVGVIGVGKMGMNYVKVLTSGERVEEVVVWDTDSEKMQQAHNQYRAGRLDNSTQLIVQSDAIVIASPTSTHLSVLKEILRQGKPVLVEKPLVKSWQEFEELDKLYLAAKTPVFQVGYIECFNPVFRWLQSSKISSPWLIRTTRTAPWASRIFDIGVSLDLMVHDLAMLFSLETSPIVEKEWTRGAVISGFDDVVQLRLKFENENQAILYANRATNRSARLWEIMGGDLLELDLAEQTVLHGGKGPSGASVQKFQVTDPTDQLTAQVDSFLNRVHERNKDPFWMQLSRKIHEVIM